MKLFFRNYSYSIIKMFVNQFAISLFGSVLALATVSVGKDAFTFIVSLFAIAFYLFLIYNMTWEIGAKDRISVDVGKKEYRPATGLLMSLVANVPNFIIAILFTVASPFMNTYDWAGNIGGAMNFAAFIILGMYRGIMSTVSIGEVPLTNTWWAYFIIIIPSLVTSFLAYYLGFKNFRVFAAMGKKDDAPKKK